MRSISKLAAFVGFLILFSSSAFAATVTGTVKGPDGAPFEGAFVQAVNAKTKISVSVLSDKQGRYRVEKPAGRRVSSARESRWLHHGSPQRGEPYRGPKYFL